MNPLARRGFTRNIKHYFIRKTTKKYSRLSSAAVVIGPLRVKCRFDLTVKYKLLIFNFQGGEDDSTGCHSNMPGQHSRSSLP